MRIGISCHSTAGGSGILATELGIALAKRGHTIHFVTTEPLFRLRGFYENIFCHTVNLVPYPLFRHLPFTLALSTKMFEVAKEHDIELWHVHYAIPYAACAVIAREMMPKDQRFHIVTTLHGTDITLVGIDPSYFHLTKFAMERSCTVTAVSNWLANETQQAFELSKPIHTIYNFVNLDRFSVPVAHRENLAKPDEKIVMHIDGREFAAFGKKPGDGEAEWPFEKPFYLILNLAVGGAWGGQKGIDDDAFPQRMEVDYVRFYQKE